MPGLRSLAAKRRTTLPTPDVPQNAALYPQIFNNVSAANGGVLNSSFIQNPNIPATVIQPSSSTLVLPASSSAIVSKSLSSTNVATFQNGNVGFQSTSTIQAGTDVINASSILQSSTPGLYTRTAFSAPPPANFTSDFYSQQLPYGLVAAPQTPTFLSINSANASAAPTLGYNSLGSLILLPAQTPTYSPLYAQSANQPYILQNGMISTQQSPQVILAQNQGSPIIQQSFQSFQNPTQNAFQSPIYQPSTYSYQNPSYISTIQPAVQTTNQTSGQSPLQQAIALQPTLSFIQPVGQNLASIPIIPQTSNATPIVPKTVPIVQSSSAISNSLPVTTSILSSSSSSLLTTNALSIVSSAIQHQHNPIVSTSGSNVLLNLPGNSLLPVQNITNNNPTQSPVIPLSTIGNTSFIVTSKNHDDNVQIKVQNINSSVPAQTLHLEETESSNTNQKSLLDNLSDETREMCLKLTETCEAFASTNFGSSSDSNSQESLANQNETAVDKTADEENILSTSLVEKVIDNIDLSNISNPISSIQKPVRSDGYIEDDGSVRDERGIVTEFKISSEVTASVIQNPSVSHTSSDKLNCSNDSYNDDEEERLVIAELENECNSPLAYENLEVTQVSVYKPSSSSVKSMESSTATHSLGLKKSQKEAGLHHVKPEFLRENTVNNETACFNDDIMNNETKLRLIENVSPTVIKIKAISDAHSPKSSRKSLMTDKTVDKHDIDTNSPSQISAIAINELKVGGGIPHISNISHSNLKSPIETVTRYKSKDMKPNPVSPKKKEKGITIKLKPKSPHEISRGKMMLERVLEKLKNKKSVTDEKPSNVLKSKDSASVGEKLQSSPERLILKMKLNQATSNSPVVTPRSDSPLPQIESSSTGWTIEKNSALKVLPMKDASLSSTKLSCWKTEPVKSGGELKMKLKCYDISPKNNHKTHSDPYAFDFEEDRNSYSNIKDKSPLKANSAPENFMGNFMSNTEETFTSDVGEISSSSTSRRCSQTCSTPERRCSQSSESSCASVESSVSSANPEKGVHIVLKKLENADTYSCFRTKRKLPSVDEREEMSETISSDTVSSKIEPNKQINNENPLLVSNCNSREPILNPSDDKSCSNPSLNSDEFTETTADNNRGETQLSVNEMSEYLVQNDEKLELKNVLPTSVADDCEDTKFNDMKLNQVSFSLDQTLQSSTRSEEEAGTSLKTDVGDKTNDILLESTLLSESNDIITSTGLDKCSSVANSEIESNAVEPDSDSLTISSSTKDQNVATAEFVDSSVDSSKCDDKNIATSSAFSSDYSKKTVSDETIVKTETLSKETQNSEMKTVDANDSTEKQRPRRKAAILSQEKCQLTLGKIEVSPKHQINKRKIQLADNLKSKQSKATCEKISHKESVDGINCNNVVAISNESDTIYSDVDVPDGMLVDSIDNSPKVTNEVIRQMIPVRSSIEDERPIEVKKRKVYEEEETLQVAKKIKLDPVVELEKIDCNLSRNSNSESYVNVVLNDSSSKSSGECIESTNDETHNNCLVDNADVPSINKNVVESSIDTLDVDSTHDDSGTAEIKCSVSLCNVFCGWPLCEMCCVNCDKPLTPGSILVDVGKGQVEMTCEYCDWLVIRRVTTSEIDAV